MTAVRPAPDREPLRGAIIGYGTIAQGHLTGYARLTDLAVTAVVDPCAARRSVATGCGLRAYPTLADLLGGERPDFLDVCTPPSSHWDYIAAALDQRIPVLCEKPVFVPSTVDYPTMLKQIEAAGTIVYPCQNYKFAPVFAGVRALVGAGRIGEVRWARIAVVRAGHARGVAQWNADWRRDDALSAGGILRDHGPHGIYLATSLTGLVPESVSCVLGSMSQAGGANEDTALVRIRCAGGADIELSLTWAAALRDSRYTLVGTRGFVSIENDTVVAAADGGLDRQTIRSGFDDPAHGDWFAAMMADFRAAVVDPGQRAGPVRELVREAMMTTAVIDTAYRSAGCGGTWCTIPPPAAAWAD